MNWDAFTRFSSFDIQLHWATVTLAFVLGLAQLLLAKGTTRHRHWGRAYAALMIVTAVSAFFIRRPAPADWTGYASLTGMSWIHLFILPTVIVIPLGVLAAMRGDVRAHKRHMVGSFLGALVIAGTFTFVPGRRMHLFLFGDEADAARWEEMFPDR